MPLRHLPWLLFATLQATSELPSLLCEDGLGGILPGSFFERFQLFQRHYARDSLQRSREFLYTIYLPKLTSNLDDFLAACPVPVLELMMNAVLAVDSDYSFLEAKELYEQTMQHAQRLASENAAVEAMLQAWRGDTAATYSFLLSDAQRHCYGSALKIFVYDVPPELVTPVLDCAHGQWGTEVLLHRFLLQSECRTRDPEEADFFFVPIYSTCLSVRSEDASKLFERLVLFLSEFPSFRRRQLRDHVFLFADGQSARVWESYDLIRSEAILLMTEAKCPTWDEPVRRYTDVKACGSAWKDVIIPGHTDLARAREMRRLNLPSGERDLLLTFHGRHPGSHEVYKSCKVRGSVLEMSGLDGVDVGGFVEDYLERKGRAHFCLVPGGTSPWTNHLYESFFSGCIPVILSDEYEVAFQHVLDWRAFSIKWPEEKVGEELYEFLRSFDAGELRRLKEQVDEKACWFDYYSAKGDCSPYLAVLRALEERKRRFPKSAGRFWRPGAELEAEGARRTTRFHVLGNESFLL